MLFYTRCKKGIMPEIGQRRSVLLALLGNSGKSVSNEGIGTLR